MSKYDTLNILFLMLYLVQCSCNNNLICNNNILEFLLNSICNKFVNVDIIVSSVNQETTEINFEIQDCKINTYSRLWNIKILDENDEPLLVIFPCLNETEFVNELSNIVIFIEQSKQYKSGRLWTPIFIFIHPHIFQNILETEMDSLITPFITKFQISICIYILYRISTENTMIILIREIYSIHGSLMNQIINSNSSGQNTFQFDQLFFRTLRRSNFQKSTIVAIGIDDANYPLATKFKPNTTELIGGFEVEIFHYFRDALNFSESAIKGIGYVREGPNQTLTGYSIQLNKDYGDIGIPSGEFLEYRFKGPDGITYLHPIFHAHVMAYFKQPPASSIRNIFIQTFTFELWICTLCVWTLIVIILRIFARLVKRNNNGLINPMDDGIANDSILWVTSTACQRGWHFSPDSTPIKIVFFCGIFTGLISYIAYSASLVSILAVEVVPIREFKDLITEKFFITSDSHIPTAKVIVKDLEDTHAINKLDEGTRNVEIDESLEKLFETRFALVTIPDSFYPVIEKNYTNNFICNTVATKMVSPRPLKSSCFVKRGSPFREFFNYKLLQMQERGIKYRLIKEYIYGTSTQCLQSSGSVYIQLGLRDLFTAFVILGFGFGISILSITAEKFYFVKKFNTEHKY